MDVPDDIQLGADFDNLQSTDHLSNEDKRVLLEEAINRACDARNRSMLKSDECLQLTKEYSSSSPNGSEILRRIINSAEEWMTLDKSYMENIKELRTVHKTVLALVDGQENFMFPAGMANEVNNKILVDKIKAAGYHARDLDHFIDTTERLTVWEEFFLKTAVSRSYQVRSWVLGYTSSMFTIMGRYTVPN